MSGNTRPLHVRLVDFFAVRNYAYLVSAILMLAGAYRLMQVATISGDLFNHTLFVLGILAAYEILLIGTAVFVVRTLGIHDQGRLLSLIALTLALDPTFFNQSLGTFHNRGNDWGLAINAFLLTLLPLKAWILWRYSNASFSPRLFGAYLAAGAFVYLSPFMFLAENPAVSYPRSYAALVWAPVVVCWTLPRRTAPGSEGDRFLVALSLVAPGIVLLHLFNTGNVHLDVISLGKFQPTEYPGAFIVAPVLLATNILQLRLKTSWAGSTNHRQWLSIGPAFAVFLAALPSAGYHVEFWNITLSPLHLTIVIAILIYWSASNLLENRMYRWGAVALGFLATLGADTDAIAANLKEQTFLLPGLYIWVFLAAVAIRRRTLPWTLIATEVLVWGTLMVREVGTPTVKFQVMAWVGILITLAWRRRWDLPATFFALAAFFQAFIHLVHTPDPSDTLRAYIGILTGLIAAGSLLSRSVALRVTGFVPLGILGVKAGWPVALQAIREVTAWLHRSQAKASELPPGTYLILLAFLVFGLAIWFSFRRKSLADWVEKRETPPPDPSGAAGPESPRAEENGPAHSET